MGVFSSTFFFEKMGQIISLLQNNKYKDFQPRFDDCKPLEKDRPLYEELQTTLSSSDTMLQQIKDYKAEQEVIRTSMSNPTPETEREAFEKVLVNVKIIHGFYDFAEALSSQVPKLVKRLSEEEKENIVTQEALAKQLATCVSFVVMWDQGKMHQPNLQNDYAYFKRNLAKQATAFELDRDSEDKRAGLTSFFLAEAMPMTKKLLTAMQNEGTRRMRETIAEFSNACCYLIKSKKFPDDSPYNKLCLRAMVGCLIIFDHTDPVGAFGSKTIKARSIVTVLCKDYPARFPSSATEVNTLKSMVQYGTKTYGSTASATVTKLIEG